MNHRRYPATLSRRLILPGAVLCAILAAAMPAEAVVLHVDNSSGNDRYDGRAENVISPTSGPVRTIRRALQLADGGDVISLKNTGIVYDESINLVGVRHSGVGQVPFVINGNGSILDGTEPIPPTAWEEMEKDLWRIRPFRKGFYQLVRDAQPVPEHPCPRGAKVLPELPEGHWCAFAGDIWYRARRLEEPDRQAYRFARRGVGVSLYNVRGVVVQNLTIRHFRLDGVNAHDLCRDILLQNVTAIENGRAGVTIAGTSSVRIVGSGIRGNRHHSVLVSELGAAEVTDTQVDQPPTVEE